MTGPSNGLGEPLRPRHCAFCRKGLGCFAYPTKVLESLGGEQGNGYAHLRCLTRAKKAHKP
jgi:hypothetical protein